MIAPGTRPPQEACIGCGTCCKAEVPVTLAELARLAAFLGRPAEAVFRTELSGAISPTFDLPLLGKRADGLCRQLDDAGRCRVHAVKPRLCRAFFCLEHALIREAGAAPDPDASAAARAGTCGIPDPRCPQDPIEWIFRSPEAGATRVYMIRHGLDWHAADFLRAARTADPLPPRWGAPGC